MNMGKQLERPIVRSENGYAVVDAVLGMTDLCLRPSVTIAQMCQREYRKDFRQRYLKVIKWPNDKPVPEGEYSCTSILELVSMAACQGTKLRIRVEEKPETRKDGRDETAEELALILYSALTSSNKENIQFGRFYKMRYS